MRSSPSLTRLQWNGPIEPVLTVPLPNLQTLRLRGKPTCSTSFTAILAAFPLLEFFDFTRSHNADLSSESHVIHSKLQRLWLIADSIRHFDQILDHKTLPALRELVIETAGIWPHESFVSFLRRSDPRITILRIRHVVVTTVAEISLIISSFPIFSATCKVSL